jgi:hydrogenase nickel incorporation protein HypA/HybF
MHELSIISNVVTITEEAALKEGLKKVTRINLLVGALNQVVPEMMQFAFETITKNTLVENSELNIINVPIKMKCRSCNHTFIVEEHVFLCIECNSADLELIEGKELFIQSIEGEK